MDDKIIFHEDFNCFFPAYDHKPKKCLEFVQRGLPHMMAACSIAKGHDVCVQAGGHAGFWADKLSREFSTVYSFEPEPILFECMRRNLDRWNTKNVVFSDKALGAELATVHLRPHCSAGSWRITEPTEKTIPVDQVTIDSLNLPSCDAIFLDIEHYEIQAMIGALATIEKFKPVLHVEVLGGEEDRMKEFMASIDYKHYGNYGLDRVYVPEVSNG